MKRKIIDIDADKCNGCGLCADACHEGAIGVIDGKAKLLREDFCDGLGNCLPACPTGAIAFTEREAPEFNEKAVKMNQKSSEHTNGCPGAAAHGFERNATGTQPDSSAAVSELRNWPVQIKLAPVNARYFDGAELLIAADCAAYSRANFHSEFMRGKITLIGCPKLDDVDYTEKLTEIIARNTVKSLTVVRMEVPCCGGIEQAALTALKNSGKLIPRLAVTFSTEGEIID